MDDKISDDAGHPDHDRAPPDEADSKVLPQRKDEQGREEVELHVVGHVPSHPHALQKTIQILAS